MAKSELTRSSLLQKAFILIYQQGYQATSIDEIIATTKVTKGAFFYHFKNKEEMGLAIINEVMYEGLIPYMRNALGGPGNIRANLYSMMENLLREKSFFIVDYGCPAVNMIDEMAPLNPAFKNALLRIIKQWHLAITSAIESAQQQREIGANHKAADLATYIISNYSGIRNTGKVLGEASYDAFLNEYKKFLDQLN